MYSYICMYVRIHTRIYIQHTCATHSRWGCVWESALSLHTHTHTHTHTSLQPHKLSLIHSLTHPHPHPHTLSLSLSLSLSRWDCTRESALPTILWNGNTTEILGANSCASCPQVPYTMEKKSVHAEKKSVYVEKRGLCAEWRWDRDTWRELVCFLPLGTIYIETRCVHVEKTSVCMVKRNVRM